MGRSLVRVERNLGGSIRSYTLMRRIVASTLLACALLALWPAAQALARPDPKKAIWGPVTRNGVSQAPIYRALGAKIFETNLPWASVAPNPPTDPTNPGDPAYQWPAEVDVGRRAVHGPPFRKRIGHADKVDRKRPRAIGSPGQRSIAKFDTS
jgi:hypothetical protein